MDYIKFEKELQGSEKIIILTHKNPDGDAIGSTIGLKLMLRNMGYEAVVIVPNEAPSFLNWIASYKELLNFESETAQASAKIKDADLIFCLDFNALHRIGEMGEIVGNSKALKVLIDHHLQPDDFADYVLSKTSASSTCELIYEFAEGLKATSFIDKNCAEAIYTGLITDTGSFKFPSTSSYTHTVAGALIEKGADNGKVHQLIYDSSSISRIKVLGYCLNHMELIDDRIAYFNLSSKTQDELGIVKGDTEGIVNYGLSIKSVNVSAFFREEAGRIKISFRSKGDHDVNAFARKHFDGGGHKNAAGGISEDTLAQTIEKFKTCAKTFF